MKILLAAAIYPPDPGGPATHAAKLNEVAGAFGHDVRVVSFSKYRHLPVGVRHIRYLIELLRNVMGVDVVYAYDARSSGGPAALTAFLFCKPLVLRIGGDVVWESAAMEGKTALSMRDFYKMGEYRQSRQFYGVHKVLQYAKNIIVTSPLLVSLYQGAPYHISPEKITLLGNPLPRLSENSLIRCQHDVFEISRDDSGPKKMTKPLPTRRVDSELRSSRTVWEKALVFASRLVAYKNLDLLIDAFAAVYEEITPAKLYLCGTGPEAGKLRAQVARLGLSSQIIFGYRPRTELNQLLASCAGTIAPALTEFNPNYLLEGLAFGKPFLLSREHGLPFAVPEELLFDPNDRKELERKLVWFFSEDGREKAKKLTANIPRQPTWEENIRAQLEVLQSCAS